MKHDRSVSDTIPDSELDHARAKQLSVEKLHAPLDASTSQRSLARSIAIVATCTAAMLVNVGLYAL